MEAAPCQLNDQNGFYINHAEVIIESERGTTFPTKVGTTVCNALIDTGATRCCISEEYNRKLQLSKISLLQNVSVRSATGSNSAPIELVNCAFMLGDILFNANFIVCKNVTRPLILGRDFLIQNHITVRYSENGKFILDHKQQELVAATDVEVRPQLRLMNSISLPGRTLAVVHMNNNLSPEQSGQLYEVEPNYLLASLPTCISYLYIIPMLHNVDLHKTENVPLVAIKFLTDNIYLSKGEIMGFMQSQRLDILEIVTETSTEPSPISLEEGDDTGDSQEQKRSHI